MLVFFTFLLGRRLFDTGTALAGAALVAWSPVVVFMSLTPMSDHHRLPSGSRRWRWLFAARRQPPCSRRSSRHRHRDPPEHWSRLVFPWLLTIVRCGPSPRAAAGPGSSRRAASGRRSWSAGSTPTCCTGRPELGIWGGRPGVLAAEWRREQQAVSGVVAGEPGADRVLCSGFAVAGAVRS